MQDEEILNNNLNYTFFPWISQKSITPICIDKGEGVYLYETNGRRILDFSSSLMSTNIGYGNKKITDAAVEQMKKISFVSPHFVTESRGKLGKKLSAIFGNGLTKFFFSTCGATAVENAMKISRFYTGRNKIIAKYRSYHGSTHGAMTLGGDLRKTSSSKALTPNIIHVEDPYCYRCPWNQNPTTCKLECVDHVERILEFEDPKTISAIFMEGESGTSGCIKYPKNYLKKIRTLCDKHGILLVIDEIISGFGRTGKWFGFENHDVVPDIVCMAKGLTSGYIPFGCIAVKDFIAHKFDYEPLMMGSTYNGHALGCAVALAVLEVYETNNLIENSKLMGFYMDSKLKILKEKHICVGDYRNTGLLGCLEIVKNRKTKEPMFKLTDSEKEFAKVMGKMSIEFNKMGLCNFITKNFIFISPPLVINKKQIDEGIDIYDKVLSIADIHCC